MRVYTVRRQEPNTDREFQAYVDLLEEIGIDLTNVPRIPEPGTAHRWLYVWNNRAQAERFARELRTRLLDSSWTVHEFDLTTDQPGPLVPLTILSLPGNDGIVLRIEPHSQARIMQHYPNARLAGALMVSHKFWPSMGQPGSPEWREVLLALTGLQEQDIATLGGVRVTTPDGKTLYKSVPSDTAR